jgi:hypothetical protein
VLFLSFEGDEEASAQETIRVLGSSAPGSMKGMDLFQLAMAYCRVGRSGDCQSKADAAIALMGAEIDTPVFHHNLAEALATAQDRDAAAVQFQRAYEGDPQNMTFRMDYEATRKTAGE